MSFSAFTAAALTSANLLNSVALAERFIALSLADSMDPFNSPIVRYVGDAAGMGSAVLRHRLIGLGWSVPMDATIAENTDISATSVDPANADVTIARRALRFDESQLAQIVGSDWGFDPEVIGMTMVESFKAGRVKALATTIAGASTNITSASTGDIDDLYDVIDQFASVGYHGTIFGMIHPTFGSAVRDSLRSEVGPAAYRGDVQAYRALGLESLLGCVLFPSTHVISAASKYENAFMAEGAIAYGIGSTGRVLTQVQVQRPAGLPVIIDMDIDSSAATVEIVGNGYDGQKIREQSRIVGVLSATS